MASTDRPSGLLKWGAANTEPSELPNTSGSPASSESVARLPVTVKVAALLVADPDALVKTARPLRERAVSTGPAAEPGRALKTTATTGYTPKAGTTAW